MKKNDRIPLFPLGLILLPYEKLPLHIFEPRYKAMIADSIENNKLFGIVFNDSNNIYKIGCQARVVEVLETYSDGKSNIIVEGLNRFQIIDTFTENKLTIGEIEELSDAKANNRQLIDSLYENYFKILLKFGNNIFLDRDINKKISFEFVQNMLLPLKIKKKLISLNSEEDRIDLVNQLFTKILSLPFDDINESIAKA